MEVIAITENGEDFAVAVIGAPKGVDIEFAKEARSLPSWVSLTDDECRAAYAFVQWLRQTHKSYADKPLVDCLENESYAWTDCLDVYDVFQDEEWEDIGHVADFLADKSDKAIKDIERIDELLKPFRNGDKSEELFQKMADLYEELEEEE